MLVICKRVVKVTYVVDERRARRESTTVVAQATGG